jgi:flagellum-specific ATP synthase
MEKAQHLRRLLAAYSASEDLVRIGAYQKGSDPVLDQALLALPELNRFLEQTPNQSVTLDDSVAQMLAIGG